MTFRVLLTIRARNNLDAAYLWYRKQSSEVAYRWYRGLRNAMRRLNQNPDRFPLADEDDTSPYPLREMLYGLGRKKTHRVLFVVRPNAVMIYAIRHVAQKRFNPYPQLGVAGLDTPCVRLGSCPSAGDSQSQRARV